MFKARTSRTLLTILGMSVGISAILFLVSLGYGLQSTLLEKITTSDALLTLDVTSAKSGESGLNNGAISEIKSYSGVDEISPSFNLTAQGKIDDLSADLVLISADPSFLELGGIKIKEGEDLNNNNPEGIVISSSIAQVFGKDEVGLIGQEMTFSISDPNSANAEAAANAQNISQQINIDKTFKIIGVIDSSDNIIYANSESLSDLNVNNFNDVKVKCHSSGAMASIRNKIISQGFAVSSLSDTVDQANKVFGAIQFILMLFGIIALVVSAIGMFNTMTIALMERTEEIGIMKSIGASNNTISAMFITESAIMGFLGGLGGVVLGFIEGKTLNLIVNLIAVRFGGQPVNLFSSPLWFISTIIIFAAIVGFVTGIAPARKASSIDPLDALRYK